jgi:hypothetical protein
MLSSILGITQNESVRLIDISFSGFQQSDEKTPFAKTALHISSSEKDMVYENEEEDNKEKSLDDIFVASKQNFISFISPSGLSANRNTASTVSLNILYCVFII